jgi:hypothetical protein
MQHKNAVRIVSALALLVWVLTFVIVILTIIALSQWHVFSAEGTQLLTGGDFGLAVVNMLLVAVLGSAIGYGLWHFRTWGRWLAIVFLVFVIVDIVLYVYKYPFTLGLLLLAAAAGVAFWLLAFNKSVRALFHA